MFPLIISYLISSDNKKISIYVCILAVNANESLRASLYTPSNIPHKIEDQTHQCSRVKNDEINFVINDQFIYSDTI